MELNIGQVLSVVGQRYGDDVNAGSMLNARINEWLDVKPRLWDCITCQGPEFVVRRGKQDTALTLAKAPSEIYIETDVLKLVPTISDSTHANITRAAEPTLRQASPSPEEEDDEIQWLPSADINEGGIVGY